MRRLFLLSLLVGLVPLSALAEPPPEDAPATESAGPTYEEGFVLQPVFRVGEDRYPAGTGSALMVNGQIVVMAPYHLLGPAGGLPQQVAADEVGSTITLVIVNDKYTGREISRSETLVALPDAVPLSEDPSRDLVGFVARSADRFGSASLKGMLRPRTLAATAPKVGDTVWMAGQMFSGAPLEQRLHKATVVELGDGVMYYDFEATGLDLSGTSGAPILDAAGAVVGMNLGGGEQAGKVFGVSGSLAALTDRLGRMFPPVVQGPAEQTAPTEEAPPPAE